MASTVSEVRNPIPESNKSLEVHSGDDESGAEDVSPRKTEESSEDISEPEESSKVEETKPGQSSADESSEDKGSEGDEEPVKVEKVAQPKKESQAKGSSRAKKNGTATALTTDLDTNAAEQVKSEGSRRERKQVERFSIAAAAITEKAVVVPHGRGTKLGDIPFIADQINKHRSDDLAYLHRFFYNKRGHTTEIKKNIRLFAGYEFDESSNEYQKKKVQLTKWKPTIIRQLCDVLGLLKKGTKEQVVERILEFCLTPTDSGAKPKVKAKKSLSSKKSTTPKSKSKTSSSSKSKSKPKSRAQKKSTKSSDVSDEENVPDKDEKRRRSASDEDEDEPPRKRSREGPTRQAATGKRYTEVDESDSEPKAASRRKKASPVKAKISRKRSPSSDESKSSASEEEAPEPMSEDEKPKKVKSNSKSSSKKSKPSSSAKPKAVVAKKPKSSDSDSEHGEDDKGSSKEEEEKDKDSSESAEIPSDEKLKEFVVNMMKTANLKKVTMKTLMQDVATAFPQVDLTSKKSYIKDCVNEALESAGS